MDAQGYRGDHPAGDAASAALPKNGARIEHQRPLPPAILRKDLPICTQLRCFRTVAIKKDGEPAKSCRQCLGHRARSCKRWRAHFVAQGDCRRCAYHKRGTLPSTR